jgi:dTDP-4-dehydrorhamnose reductase
MTDLKVKSGTKVLVLGISGMLGHKVFEVLTKNPDLDVVGTVTGMEKIDRFLPVALKPKVVAGIYADRFSTVKDLITELKPDVVINCIGIIKQNPSSHDTLTMITINALFPQQLAALCDETGARMITVATDCVFDGQKGEPYLETDLPTCHDNYGMTKYLGEIPNSKHLTLRTSIIGHELDSHVSLLDWFLNEDKPEVTGFTHAIFSGLTTLEFADFLNKYVLPDPGLQGLYHLSVDPISKCDLLDIIAKEYGKKVKVLPDDKLKINRALNSGKLRDATGYLSPSWEILIKQMHQDFLASPFYSNRN